LKQYSERNALAVLGRAPGGAEAMRAEDVYLKTKTSQNV
jgi:hypothetical protein